MKTTIIIILIVLFTTFFFSSCKENKGVVITENNVKNIALTTNNKACFIKQEYLSRKDDKDLIFKYENENYEIKNNKEQSYNLILNGKKYLTNLNLESANINFYYYKCENKKIFMIEGDDYYSSVFFAYLFENEKLSYLGDFNIKQPNVEKLGVLKKDFNISFNNNQLSIDVLLQHKFFQAIKLKQKKNIPQESQDRKLDLNGLWRLNCENSLTTFDISDNNGYLSLYSDNAIYINVEIINIENKVGEYDIRFKNTESQQNYSGDKKNIIDNEISKSENIGRLVFKNDKLLLYWKGLYNDKFKKLEFEKDFVLIKENEDKNPIILSKCE